MRVLIVDDSNLSRALLHDFFLEFPGIELAEACDGMEALEQHRFFKPNVIFLDYTIPQPDGLATLKIIKAVDKKVKVILLSTMGEQAYIAKEGAKYGADAIICKPVTKDDALKAYRSVLRRNAGEK